MVTTTTTAWRVFKFGGSSVGSTERILRVIERIGSERDQDGQIAVVVSAMGDTTDWLIQAAQLAGAGEFEQATAEADRVADLAVTNALVTMQRIDVSVEGPLPEFTALIRETLAPLRQLLYGVSLLRECTAQTMDLIMSFGERISAQVLAHLLVARGLPAQFLDARDWTVTDGTFGEAVVDFHASRLALDAQIALMDESVIPVTTGFLGKTTDGRTTTLGRNGSDYTATLLARCLDAREVCIWTDVSGVMTGDPRLIRDAYPLERLSYMEAVELAYFGTRMFHPRTMIPLIESGIPMRIRNTMRPEDPGTTIDASGALDVNSPTSVTSLENMALIGVEWRKLSQRATVGERVLRALDSADVPVWMASQSAHGQAVAIVIPEDEVKRAETVINDELALELERREANPLTVHHGVTLLTLVCETMGQQPNVAGRFFAALGNTGVMVHAIAQGSSSRSISCVIDTENTATAVRTVHSVFNFAHEVVSLFIMGKGVVGSELLSQLAAQRMVLKEQHGIELQVVGLCSSRKIVYREDGIGLSDWQEALESQGIENTALTLRQCVEEFARLPVPILVDCTAAEGMESVYRHAFEHGVHVAAANKKPLTIPYQRLQTLRETVKHNHRTWNYETTVGASLPVIDTLINLVRTGDTVQLIEGSFSGTLGYLTNEVMSGVPLSKAVRRAKALGYTEPRPQEDLSGMDVARKALILARELGLPLELDDVALTPLVPAELLSDDMTVDQFFERLGDYDEEFTARIETMKDAGHSLRYLARIDPFPSEGEPILTVGPVELQAGHPATQLRGSEAFVAFNTARYQNYPLIVRGSGAGGAVTAAGVLADILHTAQAARGK